MLGEKYMSCLCNYWHFLRIKFVVWANLIYLIDLLMDPNFAWGKDWPWWFKLAYWTYDFIKKKKTSFWFKQNKY